MKVLVVGGGGREHALCWKLAQSGLVKNIFCAPGNGGTGGECKTKNVPIPAYDLDGLRDFALKEKIDLTVVGPELPLSLGIVDYFNERGLLVFGPTKAAARLEWCKVFAKEFMLEYGIPTAPAVIVYDATEARGYIHHHFLHDGHPLVVKAGGLAQGKGVSVCRNEKTALNFVRSIMEDREFGEAGAAVLLEHCLIGEEATFQCLVDGERILPLATAQDVKRLWDGVDAPITGGMGATSPAPIITQALCKNIMANVVTPTIRGMAARGTPYRGLLYVGLMISGGKPYVLEFNSRFGDPEAEAILVRLKSDLFSILCATARGNLTGVAAEWSPDPAVCVIMASRGYPKAPIAAALPIRGLFEAENIAGTVVFHASTVWCESENLFVTGEGGRVLAVSSTAPSWGEAVERVYGAVRVVDWGSHQRFATRQKSDPWGPDINDMRKSADPGPYCRWDIGR